MIRGLFGSSARQAMPLVEPSELQGASPRPMQERAAPSVLPQQEQAQPREFLGGLVKYTPQAPGAGPNAMSTIGATLQDVAASLQGRSGGNLEAVQEAFRQRQARAEKESLRKRLDDMIQAQYADDPEAQMLFRADPSAFVEAQLKARQPSNRYFEGPDGLYQVDERSGETRKVQEFARTAPSGWEWNGEQLRPIAGGPYDPAVIASTAGIRRDAVVERPMPSRASGGGRGGGRGGGSSGLPAGFVLD